MIYLMFLERICHYILTLASVSVLLEGKTLASYQLGPWRGSLETQWLGMPVYVCMLFMYKKPNRVVALLSLMNRVKSDCMAMYTSALMYYLFTSNPRCYCLNWSDKPCTASQGYREGKREKECVWLNPRVSVPLDQLDCPVTCPQGGSVRLVNFHSEDHPVFIAITMQVR